MPRRHTYEYVYSFIESKGFELLSDEYINAHTKLDIRCPKGHTFSMRFNDFKNGHRCKFCSGKAKYSLSDVRRIVESEGYELLDTSEYKHVNSYITTKCPLGHRYRVKFSAFNNRGDRCAECAKKRRAESNKYKYEEVVEIIEGEGYQLLSKKYKDSNTKLEIKCDKGHTFKMNLKSFNVGQRCPTCKASKGEMLVKTILDDMRIGYHPQYPVDINGSTYYYDFYILLRNGLFIEYDGVQHYKPISVFGGEEGLLKTKERDRIKDEYVSNISAEILRIPYYLKEGEVRERVVTFIKRPKIE